MIINFKCQHQTQCFSIIAERLSFWDYNFMSAFSHYFSGKLGEGNYNVPLRTALVDNILQPRAELTKK